MRLACSCVSVSVLIDGITGFAYDQHFRRVCKGRAQFCPVCYHEHVYNSFTFRIRRYRMYLSYWD